MTCATVRQDLPDRDHGIAEHLESCADCRAEADLYDLDAARLSEGFRRLAEAPLPVRTRRRSAALWISAAASLLILAATAASLFPELLAGRGGPGSAGQDKQIAELIARLGSDDIAVREAASADLLRMGKKVLPDLRRELEKAPTEEVRGRLKEVIDRLTRPVFQLVKTLPRMGLVGEWRPDGREYALADDEDVLIYDARDWSESARIDPPKDGGSYIFGLAYSPDGKILAVRHALKLCIYSVPGYREIFSTTHGGRIDHHGWDLRFLDSNRFLFRRAGNASMVLAERKGDSWDLRDLDLGDGMHFDIRPDGAEIAFGGLKVRILETRGWSRTGMIEHPPGVVGRTLSFGGNMAYSPDSTFLAAQGADLELIVLNRRTGSEVNRLQLPTGVYMNIGFGFSADSAHLITGGGDGRLRAWSCAGWEERASVDVGIVFQVRPSPVDGTVVVGSRRDPPAGMPLDRARDDRTQIFRLAAP